MRDGAFENGDQVGDYLILAVVSEDDSTQTWRARQLSMDREVRVETLKPEVAANAQYVEGFLANVRAKATIQHPNIGTVYEAVRTENGAIFAREALDGISLKQMVDTGQKLTPLECAAFLEQICAAMEHLEIEGVGTTEFSPEDFIISPLRQIRLKNLARFGEPDEATSTRAKKLLGRLFATLVKSGETGSTRVPSLCAYMYDEARVPPLTWNKIKELAAQVRNGLEGNLPTSPGVGKARTTLVTNSGGNQKAILALVGGLLLIGGLIWVVVSSQKSEKTKPTEEEVVETDFFEVPAGKYALPDGKSHQILTALEFARSEVSIGEYRDFLSAASSKRFDHSDQPESKNSHQPDDWSNLWRAAVKNEKWEGRRVTTDSPVSGVDWWDAYAYAKWKGARLPTLAEWSSAATTGKIPGFDSGVREWTASVEVNPAAPLSPKMPVAAGASVLSPKNGDQARLWLESFSDRRPDLGFRIVREK